MCDRFNDNNNEQISNTVFHRFKQKLIESNFQMKCKKCQQNPGFVLLQKKDVFCGPCLSKHCIHKFRSSIGKSHLVHKDDRVLVAFSGATSSVALVDMICQGLKEDTYRKLHFIPVILCIDDSILNNQTNDGLKTRFSRELFQFIVQSELDCIFTTLQSIIESSVKYFHIKSGQSDVSYENLCDFLHEANTLESGTRFLKCFEKLKTSSSKYDFLARLKYKIMFNVAKELDFSKIFMASTMDKLAINLFNNISFGRGEAVRMEIEFCDDRFGSSVLILRPMCELGSKDIAFYLKYRQLDHLPQRYDATSTKSRIKSGLHRINEHFLLKLAEEFPSTLYAVYKTGNKVRKSSSTEHFCQFCLIRLDGKTANDYSSLDALNFTSILSKNIQPTDKQLSSDKENYCFACRKLYDEMVDDNDKLFRQFCFPLT